MHDHRYVCQAGRQPPDETRFGRVGVNDSVGITPQKIAQANQAAEIPYWAYLASDDIQVHQAQTMLYKGLPEDRIGGQNINSPAFHFHNLA